MGNYLGRLGTGLAPSSEGALVAFAARLPRLLADVAQQVLSLPRPVVTYPNAIHACQTDVPAYA